MRGRVALAAAAIVAAGCARLPVESDGLGFSARQTRLEAVQEWDMSGRLAVDTGERAFQARFRWRQDGPDLRLTVRGPLGAGSFEIAGSAQVLTVRARGDTRVLTDPEIELSQMFGWWLPVTSLEAWLKGLPDRDYPAVTELGRAGTLAGLTQRGWDLEYGEYQLAGGVLVPRRMMLHHDTLELTLTVDEWQALTAALN